MGLKTRVFDLAGQYGYTTDKALADAMGVTPSMVCRVKAGEQKITGTFVDGALRAFSDKSLDDLFYAEDCEPALAS